MTPEIRTTTRTPSLLLMIICTLNILLANAFTSSNLPHPYLSYYCRPSSIAGATTSNRSIATSSSLSTLFHLKKTTSPCGGRKRRVSSTYLGLSRSSVADFGDGNSTDKRNNMVRFRSFIIMTYMFLTYIVCVCS